MCEEEIKLMWQGPFAWPTFDSASAASFDSVPVDAFGIYLWTVEYRDLYLIYAAGITRRPFRKRFREHTKHYLRGFYIILDAWALQQGTRAERWEGFWTKKPSAEKQIEYESKRDEILDATRKQLSAFRVFVAQVDPAPRVLERLEASIMNELYHSSDRAISGIPDRGMMLAPRWETERPIIARNITSQKMHGLPERLTI